MSKTVQIRDVPEEVHRRLVEEAKSEGTSLSEYLRGELAQISARSRNDEILRRAASRTTDVSSGEVLAALDEGREERGQHVLDALERRDERR